MTSTPTPEVASVTLKEALPTWIRVALLSFGGPAGQIAVMHRLVVEEQEWVEEERFLHAMSFCMLLPGPEAQRLATYLGWLLHGARGGLVAGLLFIAPGFVSIFVLSVLYAEFREVSIVAGLFYGLKPAVMAVVAAALIRIGSRALKRRGDKAIAGSAFVAIFFFSVPFPLIVVASGVIGYLITRSDPAPDMAAVGVPTLGSTARTAALWLAVWFVPIGVLAAVVGNDHTLVSEAIFFSKAAVVTFAPCFLFIFVGAPYAESLRGKPGLQGALTAITAAVVGVILNLAVWFSLHTLFGEVATFERGPLSFLLPALGTVDWAALILAVGAGVAMLRYAVGMIVTLGGAAGVGVVYYVWGVG
ncbi:MAG: chromate transporter [Gemmatimonadetes bacterium]|nr:chromate transporter [Gemmatimonadota bacterium]